MSDPTITCPKCKTEIKLTETLTAPLLEAERKKYREHLDRELDKVRAREADLQRQMQAVEQARENVEKQVDARVRAERAAIAEEEGKKARLVVQSDLSAQSDEIRVLKETLQNRDAKLADAQKAQAALMRKERELEEAKREIELTVEKRVSESLGSLREKARREADDVWQLKMRESEERISQMQRKIDELKQKAEQGSQQLQGEAFELELEDLLRRQFPLDLIEPVAKGELGADLVQRVCTQSSATVGTILWEIKRTRNWSDSWLPKLRNDQRSAGAEIALLVSQALPKDIRTFDFRDGVWVAGPECALPVAIALRELLISVAAARTTSEGQLTKMELVYEYLTGPRFRHRVEAIVEQFTEMQSDLERERKVMTKQWAKREQQIRCVLESTAGMYGDLQGIAGKSIQEVEGLSVNLIEGPPDA